MYVYIYLSLSLYIYIYIYIYIPLLLRRTRASRRRAVPGPRRRRRAVSARLKLPAVAFNWPAATPRCLSLHAGCRALGNKQINSYTYRGIDIFIEYSRIHMNMIIEAVNTVFHLIEALTLLNEPPIVRPTVQRH